MISNNGVDDIILSLLPGLLARRSVSLSSTRLDSYKPVCLFVSETWDGPFVWSDDDTRYKTNNWGIDAA